MRLLAHRGAWRTPAEQNTPGAFERALAAGDGIETDVRDAAGELVIAHESTCAGAMRWTICCNCTAARTRMSRSALNIKADGLSIKLAQQLRSRSTSAYFCFDMSVPEMLRYRRDGCAPSRVKVNMSVRRSLQQRGRRRIDQFETDWTTVGPDSRAPTRPAKKSRSSRLNCTGGRIGAFWQRLRGRRLSRQDALMLCTDFPGAAREFSMAKINAVIFDMDGVLIDARSGTTRRSTVHWGSFGFTISRYDHLVTYDGLPTRKKLEMLSRDQGLSPISTAS